MSARGGVEISVMINLCQLVLDGKECPMNGKKVGWCQYLKEKETLKIIMHTVE